MDEFKHATEWKTKPIKGSLKVVDEEGKPMAAEKIAEIAKANLKDAEYNLSQRMIKDLR